MAAAGASNRDTSFTAPPTPTGLGDSSAAGASNRDSSFSAPPPPNGMGEISENETEDSMEPSLLQRRGGSLEVQFMMKSGLLEREEINSRFAKPES